jgi:hypothetical protein
MLPIGPADGQPVERDRGLGRFEEQGLGRWIEHAIVQPEQIILVVLLSRSGFVRSFSFAPVRSSSGRTVSRPISAARASPTLLAATAVSVACFVCWAVLSAIFAMRSAARLFSASFLSALTLANASESDGALFGEGAAGFGCCVLFDLCGTTDIELYPRARAKIGQLKDQSKRFLRLSRTCHPRAPPNMLSS